MSNETCAWHGMDHCLAPRPAGLCSQCWLVLQSSALCKTLEHPRSKAGKRFTERPWKSSWHLGPPQTHAWAASGSLSRSALCEARISLLHRPSEDLTPSVAEWTGSVHIRQLDP